MVYCNNDSTSAFYLSYNIFNHASQRGKSQTLVQNQIREGKHPSTQDEYDDLVISNIELTTSDESDDNYNLMFVRSKKENFLTLNDRARSEISSVNICSIRSTASFRIASTISTNILSASETTPSTETGTSTRESWDMPSVTYCSEK